MTRLAALATVLLLAVRSAPAAVPRLIAHEGRLLRSDGSAERGGLTLIFSLYETAAGGAVAWTETQAVTLGASGFYAVHLGALAALPAFDGRPFWLGIAVQGEPEMLPRARLTSAPYALRAGDVDAVAGHAATDMAFLSAGKLAEAMLPAAVPLLTPAQLAGLGGQPARVPLLDPGTSLIPMSYLPGAQGGTVSASWTDLAAGQCQTVTHNFGTRAVFFQVWMTDNGNWVPLGQSSRGGDVNIALGKPCTATSTYSGAYPCNNALDGSLSNGWHSVAGDGLGFITIDLGILTMIDRVRVAGHSYNTGWEIKVSTNGTTFSGAVGTGACSVGGSCGTLVETAFPAVSARYVRIQDIGGDPTYTYFPDIEIFGAIQPVTQPSVDELRFCNLTGATRSFALVAGR